MKKTIGVSSTLWAAILCITFYSLIFFHSAAWAGSKHVTDELLIKPKAGVSQEKMSKVLGGLQATSVGEIPALRVQKINVPSNALEKVKTALSKNPHIAYVEYNYIAEVVLTPNDEQYPSQWHLPKISAPQGWDINTGSNGLPIAIIDSGVNQNHPDLSGKILAGYNFLNESTGTNDIMGHGTLVSGAAAALSNNVVGVASVAWNNPIVPLVVVNKDGWATYYDISRAITYAADLGVKVMNISIAGTSYSYTLQNAVNYAWDRGAIIVAAAGNSATSMPNYPAACDHVIAVSATDSSDARAYFSTYGNWIDISAPGVSILTTTKEGGYSSMSGTSLASPLTAGLAALIMSTNPYLSNTQVVGILRDNADDLGTPGFDDYYGSGRINIYKSLLATTGAVPEPDTLSPSVDILSPSNGSTVGGNVTVTVSASDNTAVSAVELYIGGIFFGTDTTYPYSFLWDTAVNYPDGPYELMALAYDSSQNVGQSGQVTVYVSNVPAEDLTAPSVSIDSPSEGSSVRKFVNIRATAFDNVGVSRVEFYADNVLLHTEYGIQDSYRYRWDTQNTPSGAHTISVMAYDDAGNSGTDSCTVYK